MKKEELRSQIQELRARIVELSEKADITADENAELDAALEAHEARTAEFDAIEAREARIASARSRVVDAAPGVDAPQIMKRTATDVDVSRASRSEIRDAALAILDRDGKHHAARNGDHVEALLRTRSTITDGGVIAKRMVLTESDAYRSAFMKGVTQVSPAFTADEARALDEYRAMSEGTDTAGGFGIPVLIDPSIILTSGAAAAPVLELARVVTITTD
ncbi:MAG TPA: hypothetical protein VIG24_13685, partial [Acidimicrobiia bacterium]